MVSPLGTDTWEGPHVTETTESTGAAADSGDADAMSTLIELDGGDPTDD